MEKIKENIHNDFKNLKQNKEQYFNEFYNNNYNLVYRISFSILKDKENSEDVTQNVFEKIYKLPNEKLADNFESTWLYTVTKNESLQYIRKNKFNVSLDENINVIKSDNNEIDDIAENEDYNKIVKKLNKKEEQIISLKVLSEFTFKEIGEILSMPTATVQWYYYKSIKSLKIAISNFAMFIIALVTGLKIGIKTDNKTDKSDTELNFATSKEENQQNLNSSDINSESTSISGSASESDTSSFENSHITGEVIESISTNDFETKSSSLDVSTISVGLFSLAGVFLLISIIFSIIFIKHQQKGKKKSSKK
ncbi:MAG: sigma-70 family RNA polymerase sigma factor [Clostridia bacterium]|nr:sigma-70 family RNA polymerase sigma factor [Clostridia bacterium]